MTPNDFLTQLHHVKNLEITWHEIINCPTTPKFYYFLCEIKLEGLTALGTGESFLPNYAKLKSIAEALERWAIQNPNLEWKNTKTQKIEHIHFENSNGVAFHLNEDEALKGAAGELIERDAILNAYHKKNHPIKLQIPKKWQCLNLINKWKYGLKDVYFLLFPSDYDEYVVSCVIEKDSSPYRIFGYGHSTKLEKAIEKSWTEAWRFFWNLLDNSSYENKIVEKIDSPLDHLYFHAYNPINIDDVFHIQKDANFTPSNRSLTPDNIWSACLESFGLPGKIVKVENHNIQNLYFGANNEQKCKIHPIG